MKKTFNTLKNIVFGVLFLYGVYVALNAFGVFGTTHKESFVKAHKEDIETTINSSITSIQAQNKLLVMSSRMNSQATSTISSSGMTAQQTDISSAELQYFVDMKRINRSMVVINDSTIVVNLPKDILSVSRGPDIDSTSYNNGSWLFNLDSTTGPTLSQVNREKIQKSLMQQGEGLKPQAYVNARESVAAIFEIPLISAGVDKKVIVNFN